ncbi:MAG: zinc-ribbon domain-containing protein, partial [Myxococcales bacterium]|nr:zinc-ribbon domain-containing protein [Myxococcales bacterium]
MRFNCQNCAAKYQIADEKVSGKTVRMKCRKCGELIQVRAEASTEGVAPVYAPVGAPRTRGNSYAGPLPTMESTAGHAPGAGLRARPAGPPRPHSPPRPVGPPRPGAGLPRPSGPGSSPMEARLPRPSSPGLRPSAPHGPPRGSAPGRPSAPGPAPLHSAPRHSAPQPSAPGPFAGGRPMARLGDLEEPGDDATVVMDAPDPAKLEAMALAARQAPA